MFGLTKREQRWKADQEAAALLVDLAKTVVNATARIEEKRRTEETQQLADRKEQIDRAVSRFLGWQLPKEFGPDCHISFDRAKASQYPFTWPVGTNLFTADQARAMFEHCLGG